MTINPAVYLFDLVLVISLIALLFKVIQSSIYRKTTRKTNLVEGIGAWLIFIFYMVTYLKADQFIPEILAFTIPDPWDIFLIVALSLVATVRLFKFKEKAFYSIALFLIIPSLIGINLRLEAHTDIFISTTFKIITLLMLTMGIGYFIVRRKRKKPKK